MTTNNTFDLFYVLEVEHLRLQALERYEQCLVEQTPQQLEQFIEEQIGILPPPLYLLQRIADDLQQRLVTLQAHQQSASNYVVELLALHHDFDIYELLPDEQIERLFEVPTSVVLACMEPTLHGDEREQLRQTLHNSRHIGRQLQRDVELTLYLLHMILDWSHALSIDYTRAHPLWHTGILTQLDAAYIH
jgi:hypothetical protein